MGRTLSKNKYGDYKQGFRPIGDYYETVSLPVTSGVAIAKGDLVTLSSGFIALETTLAATDVNVYIAVSENTAAEASADGVVDCQCIPMTDFNVRYMCPCQADAVLAQATHVGNVYNLSGTTGGFGITVASAVTAKCGFMVEEIDISDEAIAVETFGFAIGRFIAFPDAS